MIPALCERLDTALADWPEPRAVLRKAIQQLHDDAGVEACWSALARVLDPSWPIACHRATHDAVFACWDDEGQGPRPTWFPDHGSKSDSNAAHLCAEMRCANWDTLHQKSTEDRAGFWGRMLDRLGIEMARPAAGVIGRPIDARSPRWLPGASMNIVESCFGLSHDTPAIRWGRADGTLEDWSLEKLDTLSSRVASGLLVLGLDPGDAVAIDMPMTPESVAIYLGIIRAGMVAVSIADSFAPEEIATRLRISDAKLVFTQDEVARGGKTLPLYAKVVEAGAARCVVVPCGKSLAVELRKDDLAVADMLGETDAASFHHAPPDTPVNILFSSGTTGDPKAIPWDHTTPIKCAMDGHVHLDIREGDVVCWPTNLGWMMGPWLIFASLINKATIALYDGPPAGEGFASFVEQAGVTMLGVVPSMVKNWRSTGCADAADWSGIRCFGSTGECSNADDSFWLSSRAGYRPVIEYCGGTEIGGGYLTGSPLQPQAPSTFSTPALGLGVVLLDENNQPADSGEVYLVGPSIGLSTRLLNRDHDATYFDDCPTHADGTPLRRHGDQLTRLPSESGGGYYRADGRADDTMNLGGIKTSSAEIERVVTQAVGVKEAAAIAVAPEGGGPSELVLFVVASAGHEPDPEGWLSEMRQLIKQQLNPLFRLSRVVPIDQLPRTASNKIMRRKLREMVPHKEAKPQRHRGHGGRI